MNNTYNCVNSTKIVLHRTINASTYAVGRYVDGSTYATPYIVKQARNGTVCKNVQTGREISLPRCRYTLSHGSDEEALTNYLDRAIGWNCYA